MVMSITDRTKDYAQTIANTLTEAGYRTELDLRNEKIGFKIREAQVQKIPYMLVLGDKEAENGQVNVRKRSEGDIGAMSLNEFCAAIALEKAPQSAGYE